MRTYPRALALGARIGIALAFTFAAAGCGEKRPIPSRPAAVVPEVKSATPEQVATSLLLLAQAELRAIGHKDQAAAAKCRDLLAGLVAKNALAKELKYYGPMLGDDPVVGLVQNWCAALSDYAEGIDFARLSAPEFDDKVKSVGVYVPATGGAGRADFRIECVREGGGWLVSGMAIEGSATVKIPIGALTTSRPAAGASVPASAPAQP